MATPKRIRTAVQPRDCAMFRNRTPVPHLGFQRPGSGFGSIFCGAQAQTDPDLLRYFHVTRQARNFLDFKRPQPAFLFVARPGSGKSALLRWLEAEQGQHTALIIRSDKTRISAEDARPNTGDIRTMVAAELYASLISETVDRKIGSESARRQGAAFLKSGWTAVVGGFFKRKFGGLSILGCGFTLKPSDRRDYLQELRRTGGVETAREALKQIALTARIALVIDDPKYIVGEGLDDVTPENGLRLGAFLSVLSDLHAIGVRVVVFLKEHILQNTREHYPDFRHFSDRIEGLEWSSEDLVEMLTRRVHSRIKAKWGDVFSLDEKRLTKEVFPKLINGPRDLLSLCNTVGKRDAKITSEQLARAVGALKNEKWAELRLYYGKQWPQIDQFARAMIDQLRARHGDNHLPPGKINEEFASAYGDPDSAIHSLRRKITWVDSAKYENPPVDERLFLIGCLGFIKDNSTSYPWAGREVEAFALADLHFVSPLFIDQTIG
jgi:hypothetical protein